MLNYQGSWWVVLISEHAIFCVIFS